MGSPPGQEGTGSAPSLDSALTLLDGKTDEERVLGLAFALGHSDALLADQPARERLLASVGSAFLERLLESAPALKRVSISALRLLVADAAAAAALLACAPALAAAFSELAGAEAEEGAEVRWGTDELVQGIEVLRQFLRFTAPSSAGEDLVHAADTMLGLFVGHGPFGTMRSDVQVVEAALSLVQEQTVLAGKSTSTAAAFVDNVCSEASLRGLPAHVLALGLLAERVESGSVPACFDEALSEAMAAGQPTRAVALQLAAAALTRFGLSFGLKGRGPMLGRLCPLLELAGAEMRLGLESVSTLENLCAACMALEAAIIALGRESEALEQGADIERAADCLRRIHRAMEDVFSYCVDLPASGQPPPELALVARVVAAWQVEDPRQFSGEFERALPALCSLAPADFQVLLPCIQETHDWHLTPALGAVLTTALAALQAESGTKQSSPETWRQCALMLTEVALDAAAYLPEASMPEPPELPAAGVPGSLPWPRPASLAVPAPAAANLPRPKEAADPGHPGVLRLRDWSCLLWTAGAAHVCGPQRWELGVLCGALLVSVPEASVLASHDVSGATAHAWAAVADCLLASHAADATTWRLAARLGGFALDRHGSLQEAFARAVVARHATCLEPPNGAAPGSELEDEWAPADSAAIRVLEDYLLVVQKAGPQFQETFDSSPDELVSMD